PAVDHGAAEGGDRVVPRTAHDFSRAKVAVAVDRVGIVSAVDGDRFVSVVGDVDDRVVPAVTVEGIISVASADVVVTLAPEDHVAAGLTIQGIGVVASKEGVRSAAAKEHVAAGTAVHRGLDTGEVLTAIV